MSVPIANSPSITDWLTAIGTVGAVIVALLLAFLNSLMKRHRRPMLKIEFENKDPFCRHTNLVDMATGSPQGAGYFLRIRVRNIGKSMARDCEGKLIRIFDAATGQERTDFDPSNLHWAGQGISRTRLSIHKTAYEYLDVIYVQQNRPEIIPHSINWEPRGFPTALQRADYILDIVLFGKNTEPVEKFFKVHIEGLWTTATFDKVTLEETKLRS